MDYLIAWLLGGLFLSMIARLRQGQSLSLLVYIFTISLWPILIVGWVFLWVLVQILNVLSKVKV